MRAGRAGRVGKAGLLHTLPLPRAAASVRASCGWAALRVLRLHSPAAAHLRLPQHGARGVGLPQLHQLQHHLRRAGVGRCCTPAQAAANGSAAPWSLHSRSPPAGRGACRRDRATGRSCTGRSQQSWAAHTAPASRASAGAGQRRGRGGHCGKHPQCTHHHQSASGGVEPVAARHTAVLPAHTGPPVWPGAA